MMIHSTLDDILRKTRSLTFIQFNIMLLIQYQHVTDQTNLMQVLACR